MELVDRLVVVAIDDSRIQGLWIEGDNQKSLRRPFDKATIHAMANEPDFQPLVDGWEELITSTGCALENSVWSDTRRNARQLVAKISIGDDSSDSIKVTFVLECAAFLAKRPRKAVVPLVDKTNHLTHVMDFSG